MICRRSVAALLRLHRARSTSKLRCMTMPQVAVSHCKKGKGIIKVNGRPLSLVEVMHLSPTPPSSFPHPCPPPSASPPHSPPQPPTLRAKLIEPITVLGLQVTHHPAALLRPFCVGACLTPPREPTASLTSTSASRSNPPPPPPPVPNPLFPSSHLSFSSAILRTSLLPPHAFTPQVTGGGKVAQIYAIRQAIAKSIVAYPPHPPPHNLLNAITRLTVPPPQPPQLQPEVR